MRLDTRERSNGRRCDELKFAIEERAGSRDYSRLYETEASRLYDLISSEIEEIIDQGKAEMN